MELHGEPRKPTIPRGTRHHAAPDVPAGTARGRCHQPEPCTELRWGTRCLHAGPGRGTERGRQRRDSRGSELSSLPTQRALLPLPPLAAPAASSPRSAKWLRRSPWPRAPGLFAGSASCDGRCPLRAPLCSETAGRGGRAGAAGPGPGLGLGPVPPPLRAEPRAAPRGPGRGAAPMWGCRRPPGRHCRGTERGAPRAADGAARGENRGPADPSRSPAGALQELRTARGSRLVLAGGREAHSGQSSVRRLLLPGLFLGNGSAREGRAADGVFVLCGQRCFFCWMIIKSALGKARPDLPLSFRAPDGNATSARSLLGPAAGCLRAPGAGLRFRAAPCGTSGWAGCSSEGPSVGTCCDFGVWHRRSAAQAGGETSEGGLSLGRVGVPHTFPGKANGEGWGWTWHLSCSPGAGQGSTKVDSLEFI